MRRFFGIGRPELVGVVMFGATIGAVAGGAGLQGAAGHIALGAVCGAGLALGFVSVPWVRLRRRRPAKAAARSNAA